MKPEDLRSARLARGLTQVELAALAGVSRSTIKNIEAGRHDSRQQRIADGITDALNRTREAGPMGAAQSDDFMSTRQAAKLLQRPVGTLRQWRNRGYGPEWFRLGGAVVYRRSVVERFLTESETVRPSKRTDDDTVKSNVVVEYAAPPDDLARIAAALEQIAGSLYRLEVRERA